MDFIVVIPARYESKRLPGKPLVKIKGMPMIERTWRQCLKVVSSEQLVVATDDKRIVNTCEGFGAQVVMTSSDCKTGTDRIASLLDSFNHNFFINVQGDEPLLNPGDLQRMIDEIQNTEYDVLNGFCPIASSEQFYNPNIPKVVVGQDGELLYMSRASIPTNKQHDFVKGWRQVCIYGFSRRALESFRNRTDKTPIEDIEDIEILRFLEMGYEVKMIEMSAESIAVDIPEDVKIVVEELEKREERSNV